VEFGYTFIYSWISSPRGKYNKGCTFSLDFLYEDTILNIKEVTIILTEANAVKSFRSRFG